MTKLGYLSRRPPPARRSVAPDGAVPPGYIAAKPFHDALVAAIPVIMPWRTVWPHPRPEGPIPDAQRLLDAFYDWTPDAEHRRKILTDNPARLYGF